MKILITGGAGFIGSHLADSLLQDGYSVAVIDNLSTGRKENLNPKAKFYKMDIRDKDIFRVFENEKPEIVFHFAAQIDIRKSVADPLSDADINILGTLNILENCRLFGIKKVIFASSGGAIYGSADEIPAKEDSPELPLCPYGVAKLAAEKYLNYYYKIFGLEVVSLRFANVYGPRQNSKEGAGVVSIFIDKMRAGQEVIINGNGLQTRDFVYVKDVVRAAVLALQKQKTGVFNIGTGKETSINEVFEIIKKETKSKVKKNYKPGRKAEQKRSCLDCSRAKKELKWQPKYSLNYGLRSTLDWFEKQR